MRSTRGRSAPTRTVCRQRSRSPCARCLRVGPRTQPRRPAGNPDHALIAIGAKQLCDVDVIAGGRDVRASGGEHETVTVIASGRRLQPLSGYDRKADMIRFHRQGYSFSRWVRVDRIRDESTVTRRERHVASRLRNNSHRARIPDMSPTRRRSPSSRSKIRCRARTS